MVEIIGDETPAEARKREADKPKQQTVTADSPASQTTGNLLPGGGRSGSGVSGDGKRAALNYPLSYPASGWFLPTGGIGGFHDGFNDPRDGGRRTHYATDIMAGHGTTLFATVNGTIKRRSSGLGGTGIYLYGDDGIRYYYAHLSGYAGPSGGRVAAGQPIGFVGSTGNASSPHLHFSMKDIKTGRYINPYPYLKAGGSAPSPGAYQPLQPVGQDQLPQQHLQYDQQGLRVVSPTDVALNAFTTLDSGLQEPKFNARSLLKGMFSTFSNAIAGPSGRVDYRTIGTSGVTAGQVELEDAAEAEQEQPIQTGGVEATEVV
jgi:hypothetical protein